VGCFAYLWALMGEYRNILSGSAPLLLGIQGTTLLVATRFRATQTTRASQGFFTDLISEGGEPEIARLQMLVWNFILGIVFIWQSVFQWTMPTFDPTLMTLLGISSATYVGFKLAADSERTRPPKKRARSKVKNKIRQCPLKYRGYVFKGGRTRLFLLFSASHRSRVGKKHLRS
jgi:hypothetical protein